MFSILGLHFFLIENLATFFMEVWELLDLQVISLLIFIRTDSNMSVVLICAGCCTPVSVLTEWNRKSSKTDDSAVICDCFIAASLALSNPMKCTWNQISSLLLIRLHPGSIGEIEICMCFLTTVSKVTKGKTGTKEKKVKNQYFLHNWTPVTSPSWWLC